jgi:hypothetical protein
MENKIKFATHMDLWKYDQILTIQKSLTIKWLRFSNKRFIIWIYHLVLYYILKPNNKFEIWINIIFPFCDVLVRQPVHIFQLQKSITINKLFFLSINNHINLFNMKLLMSIQVPTNKSKDILITTCT